ncbi:hypothetical protein [Saccharomonospora iraqiensis]|uniref:hypothetical protein n=1 Tax=Saccharomonospora iraqiensis TaxID=52698 RepID=UPI001F341A1F|nr:hypothetical protein [Saccharomonospora iraqiensis]
MSAERTPMDERAGMPTRRAAKKAALAALHDVVAADRGTGSTPADTLADLDRIRGPRPEDENPCPTVTDP